MIFLNEIAILENIDYKDVVDNIETAYKIQRKNNFEMPNRIHLNNEDLTALYMPCSAKDILGVKIVTVAPKNIEKNKAIINGLMLLNDAETGEPVCLLDGKVLTAIRTGAVGGIGVKYLTKENISTIGIVGTGVQGYYQVIYATTLRNIKKIYIYDENKTQMLSFKEKLEKILTDTEIVIASNSEELTEKSELIITTTTSNEPVISKDIEKLKGKTFIGIGSFTPEMREFPDELIKIADEIYVDTEFATEESGDLSIPIKNNLISKENIKNFYEIFDSETNKDKTIVYKSVGMALFDVVVANYIYKNAQKKGIGQLIRF